MSVRPAEQRKRRDQVDRCFRGWALADQSVLDELDDLADVGRQSLRWEAADA